MENWSEMEIRKNLDELEEILSRANCGERVRNSLKVRICRIRKALSSSVNVNQGSSDTNLSVRFWERKFREEMISG